MGDVRQPGGDRACPRRHPAADRARPAATAAARLRRARRRARQRRHAAARLRARPGTERRLGRRAHARTIGEIAGAIAPLAAFVVNERRHRNPLAPLSIFKINGLGYADATQLVAFAGFTAMFFFLTLYMQNVLHFSPIQTDSRISRCASPPGSPPAWPPSWWRGSAPGR
jgi:hypothetical protein